MIKKIRARDIIKWLPRKKAKANKADSGRTLVIAGSKGMLGAGVLCGKSAARTGSGYVILMTDLKFFNTYKNPDFLTADYRKANLEKFKFNSIAIGPGLGMGKKTVQLLKQALPYDKVVVDADGLNVIAKNKLSLPSTWILTPHEGELSRLLKISAHTIQIQREKFVRLAAKKYGCIVLLKGHHTLVAYQNKCFQIQTGNQALAKAGTGDVLTGIIASFLAQGLSPLQAALAGATLHGHMADKWIKRRDNLSLMASDLIEMIPEAIKSLRDKTSQP